MCAAGDVGACYNRVRCVGYFYQMVPKPVQLAAGEKIAFGDFSRRWGSWVSHNLYHSDWLCGLQNLPQNRVMLWT